MKKLYIVWAALVLLVIVCLVVDWIPEHNPDFGLVKDVYRYDDGEQLECVGDTHIFTVDEVQWSRSGSMLGVWFRATVAEGHVIAMTTKMYDHGEEVYEGLGVSGVEYDIGTIEKLTDGEWELYCDLGFPRLYTGADKWGYPPFTWYSAGEAYMYYQAPIHEPGEYRFTYYFRECRPVNGAYSTDEELYSVSHTLTIPEASDKKFDLIAPGMSLSAWDFASVEPLIRINDGGTIYFDRSSARLEVLGDGGWTEAPTFEDDVSAVVYPMLDKDSELRYVPQEEQPRDLRNGDALKNLVQLPPIEMYIADPEAEYRLTLEFAEHEDGSGERYVLRLRFAP